MIRRKFCGKEYMFPLLYGSILDLWYREWKTPKKGASSEQMVLVVKKWKDESTWRMFRRKK
jgi:hypothetical protein